MAYPDALVFKIDEHTDSGEVDTTMYIWHDASEGSYFIRGKRLDTVNNKFKEYSFKCESVFHLVDFIGFAIDKYNKLSYTLSNYENLPETSDEIDFGFLTEGWSKSREISGYDDMKFSKKRLLKVFRMMRGVYN